MKNATTTATVRCTQKIKPFVKHFSYVSSVIYNLFSNIKVARYEIEISLKKQRQIKSARSIS